MSKKIVMNVVNEQNVNAIIGFCKKYGIEYQVLNTNTDNEFGFVADVKPAKVSKSGKSRLDAKECKVVLKVDDKRKTVVRIDGGVSKDVFGVLSSKAVALGGEYDKELKGFKFKSSKNSSEFAKITVITADERNFFRKSEWNWA